MIYTWNLLSSKNKKELNLLVHTSLYKFFLNLYIQKCTVEIHTSNIIIEENPNAEFNFTSFIFNLQEFDNVL